MDREKVAETIEPGPIMTVRYRNTFGDILWYSAFTYSRAPVVLSFLAGFAVLAFFIAFRAAPHSDPLFTRVLASGVGAIIFTLGIIVSMAVVTVLSLVSRSNRTILTDHTITICDDGLIEETAFNRTEQKWNGITQIGRTRRHVFAYVSQYAAHVIPRRAFESREDWDAFHGELRRRVPKR